MCGQHASLHQHIGHRPQWQRPTLSVRAWSQCLSSPEQKSFATTYESCAAKFPILAGHLLAGICELERLNFVTYRSVLHESRQTWQSVLSAQSPEQLVRAQADWLPSLAAQMAGYTSGWMDIASETAAKLGQFALDCHAGNSRHAATICAGMTRSARSGEAMLRAVIGVPDDTGSAPAVTSTVDSREIPRAGMSAAPAAAPAVTKGRGRAPVRRT